MGLSYKASQVALVIKNPPANAEDMRDSSLIPGSGRSPGGGHSNLLQYSCLEESYGQSSLMGGSVIQSPPARAGEEGSIPLLGRSPGEADGNPLQDFCLGNPMDRGA